LDGDVVRSFPDAALRFDDPVVLALLRSCKGAEAEHVPCLVQELGETSFEIAVGVLWVAPKRASSTSASGVRQRGIVGVLGREEPDLRGLARCQTGPVSGQRLCGCAGPPRPP
jgi:hypothetical protein